MTSQAIKKSQIYIKDHFKKQNSGTRWQNDLKVNLVNTTAYAKKSVRSLGLAIWNSLPEHLKAENTLPKF